MIHRRTEHLRPELQTEERILWEGAPSTSTAIRPHEEPQYLSGSGFCIISIAMLFGPFPTTIAISLAAWGLYLIAGWRFWDSFIRSRTWYTLTTQRACLGKDFGVYIPVRSYQPTDWSELTLISEGPLATVVFQVLPRQWNHRFPALFLRGMMDNRRGFELINNGQSVFGMMQAIKRENQ